LADFNNSYQYDFLGRMTQVVQAGTAALGQPPITRKRVDLAYNPAGQFKMMVRSSGSAGGETEVATSEYSYFNGGGLKAIVNTHTGLRWARCHTRPLLALSADNWTYDTAARVASFTAQEGTFAYGYDHTHQLTSATFTANLTYFGGTPQPSPSTRRHRQRQGTGHLVDKNRLSPTARTTTPTQRRQRLSRTRSPRAKSFTTPGTTATA